MSNGMPTTDKEIADTLLDRLHHDRPVSGSYGSVQRTARTNRSLKDDDEVLDTLNQLGSTVTGW